MIESIEQRKQFYQRMIELSDIAIQRKIELQSKGDTRYRSGRKEDDYLTEEERQEFLLLARELGKITIESENIHCQGKTWIASHKVSN
jgi:hypothetical protein